MSSSSARSRSARGSVPRGAASSFWTSPRREHVRQALALARRAQVGGRVAVEQALAAQVAVEGAQAGGLALQRRGRDGRALVAAGGELVEEAGEVRRARRRARRRPRALEVGAELQQVGAVGLERVARQPALELEVARGSRGRGARTAWRTRRRWPCARASPPAARAPRRCKRAVQPSGRARRSQSRPTSVFASALPSMRPSRSSSGQVTSSMPSSPVGVGLADLAQAGGEEDVDLLVGEARAREERRRVRPSRRPPCRSPRASSRLAVSSGSSPSTSMIPAGSSRTSSRPIASRGWRTR